MKKMYGLLAFFLFTACFKIAAQSDTAASDCYESFFKSATAVKNKGGIKLVLKDGRPSTLSAFMKANYMESDPQTGLKDLDGDGIKELVIWNYTGGAHCCDEFYFFKDGGNGKYSYAAKLFAGNTCVDESNTFVYNLHESFGYFFTCFACGLEEKKNGGKGISYIYDLPVKYKAGKLEIQAGNDALLATIKSNLAYIKNLGWDGGVKEADFDDGRRKELALTLATYYFSFGKNLVETKKLFTAYYPYKDAAKVWQQFSANLANIKKSSDF